MGIDFFRVAPPPLFYTLKFHVAANVRLIESAFVITDCKFSIFLQKCRIIWSFSANVTFQTSTLVFSSRVSLSLLSSLRVLENILTPSEGANHDKTISCPHPANSQLPGLTLTVYLTSLLRRGNTKKIGKVWHTSIRSAYRSSKGRSEIETGRSPTLSAVWSLMFPTTSEVGEKSTRTEASSRVDFSGVDRTFLQTDTLRYSRSIQGFLEIRFLETSPQLRFRQLLDIEFGKINDDAFSCSNN